MRPGSYIAATEGKTMLDGSKCCNTLQVTLFQWVWMLEGSNGTLI